MNVMLCILYQILSCPSISPCPLESPTGSYIHDKGIISFCIPVFPLLQVINLSSSCIPLFHISICSHLPMYPFPAEHMMPLLPPTFLISVLPAIQRKSEHADNPSFCASAAKPPLGNCGLTLFFFYFSIR